MLAQIPTGRFAVPEEIASAIEYLCRDEAGMINGSDVMQREQVESEKLMFSQMDKRVAAQHFDRQTQVYQNILDETRVRLAAQVKDDKKDFLDQLRYAFGGHPHGERFSLMSASNLEFKDANTVFVSDKDGTKLAELITVSEEEAREYESTHNAQNATAGPARGTILFSVWDLN
ncbi:hypothetical protein LTR66_015519 [Elasticomyces elasticus]|nr:hypothetical protein LTR66_015519 [Elasticomyces elasticus]